MLDGESDTKRLLPALPTGRLTDSAKRDEISRDSIRGFDSRWRRNYLSAGNVT